MKQALIEIQGPDDLRFALGVLIAHYLVREGIQVRVNQSEVLNASQLAAGEQVRRHIQEHTVGVAITTRKG